MPSGLFKRDQDHNRWVLNGQLPPDLQKYDQDHVALLVRYMFQMSPDEQKRLGAQLASSASKAAAAAPAKPTASVSSGQGWRDKVVSSLRR
jgi:hypothetical protein